MKYFVIEEWNGKRHCHLTDDPPRSAKAVGERLGREVERYVLSATQATFKLSFLMQLAEQGLLVRYVQPARQAQTPECLQQLGLTQPTTRQEIDKAFRALVKMAHPDQGGSHNLVIKLYNARERARKLVLA